ncbi:hypothetical protein CAPTEDRAFT_190192 [Capitella teleta]|uniref:Uncharacterized protein n=1 Tax=Capitella teleta TaxID=283909 RepID=R7UMD7_CAPTE|nr:hypothetical protein CAPTEDRAFT_190192 [Capitella teleta]|eukprot:ELU07268.1 hypothetical protein CAPTEDRAFT_190192 [Capitella teleta]
MTTATNSITNTFIFNNQSKVTCFFFHLLCHSPTLMSPSSSSSSSAPTSLNNALRTPALITDGPSDEDDDDVAPSATVYAQPQRRSTSLREVYIAPPPAFCLRLTPILIALIRFSDVIPAHLLSIHIYTTPLSLHYTDNPPSTMVSPSTTPSSWADAIIIITDEEMLAVADSTPFTQPPSCTWKTMSADIPLSMVRIEEELNIPAGSPLHRRIFDSFFSRDLRHRQRWMHCAFFWYNGVNPVMIMDWFALIGAFDGVNAKRCREMEQTFANLNDMAKDPAKRRKLSEWHTFDVHVMRWTEMRIGQII